MRIITIILLFFSLCGYSQISTSIGGGPSTQTSETPGVFNQTISETKNTAYILGDTTGFKNDDNKEYVYRAADPTTSAARHTGLVFDPVTIPAGATITTAYIELEANYLSECDAYFTLYGEDTDDANDFVTQQEILQRIRTTASAVYAGEDLPMAYWGSAIEIKTIIQEIVDRPGWASGQAMGFLLITSAGTTKLFRYGEQCRIHIEYTE